jgi:hypothetical protein
MNATNKRTPAAETRLRHRLGRLLMRLVNVAAPPVRSRSDRSWSEYYRFPPF